MYICGDGRDCAADSPAQADVHRTGQEVPQGRNQAIQVQGLRTHVRTREEHRVLPCKNRARYHKEVRGGHKGEGYPASCRGKMQHRAEYLLLLAPQDSGLPSRGLSDEKTCVPCGQFLRISGVCPCCLKAYFHFFRIKSIFTLDVNNHNG